MKEKLTIVGLAFIAIVLGIAFMYFGSGGGTHAIEAATPVSFTELSSGNHSSVTQRANYLIASEDQLRQLWKMIETNDGLPTIDFTENVVIAVFGGTEPTAGYSVAVSRILDSTTSRLVRVTLTRPGGTCVLAQSMTTPFQIIELPRSSLTLNHEDTISTISCLN